VALNVDVPAGYWKTHNGGVRVEITDDLGEEGLLLFVYDPAGTIVGEAGSGPKPTAFIPNASGAYEIRIAPELAAADTYAGTATLVTAKGAFKGFAASAPSAAYHGTIVDAQPAKMPANKPVAYKGSRPAFRAVRVGRQAAEPTVGIDKRGNVIF